MTESKSKVEEVARYTRRRKFDRTNRLNSYDPDVPLTENELDDARAAIEALRDNPPDASEVLRQKHINGYPIWIVLADANLDARTYWSIHQAIFSTVLNERVTEKQWGYCTDCADRTPIINGRCGCGSGRVIADAALNEGDENG